MQLIGAGAIGATVDYFANPFSPQMAFADFRASNAGLLFFVFFDGGPSITSVQSYGQNWFIDRYPTLFREDSEYPGGNRFVINRYHSFHPALEFFNELYGLGEAAVVLGTGYPNPNRSHAESRQIYQTGARIMAATGSSGWGARLIADEGPFGGVALSGTPEWAQGASNISSANNIENSFIERPFTSGNNQTHFEMLRTAAEKAEKAPGATNSEAIYVLENIHRGLRNADALVDSLQQPLPNPDDYPNNGFGRQCREAMALAQSGLGVKAFYLREGGFDTHANAGPRVDDLLSNVNGGLRALVTGLKMRGLWGKSAIICHGEFGRTVENGSEGDDHGHPQPTFVLTGAGLRRQVVGERQVVPNGQSFARGYAVDFRDALSEVLRKLGYNTDSLFPELSYTPPGLFT